MVLDDSSASNGFGNDVPPSDSDPYENSNANATSYYSVPANIPRSPWVSEAALQRNILKARKQQSALLKRPLTPEEAEFSAYWTARMINILSWGTPLGVVGGAYRAYATRSTFRMPFMNLAPQFLTNFNPNVFPGESMPIAKGQLARSIWHGVRGSLYISFGVFFGRVLCAGYGATIGTIGTRNDPRGKSIWKSLEEQTKRQVRPRTVPGPTNGKESAAPPYQSPENGSGVGNSTADGFPEPSPTVGFDAPSNETTGFNAPATERAAKPAASAWDRVRQQSVGGKPSSSAWRKPERPSGSGTDDAFGGSKSDEDILSARERAQREFDERVEQERHGGSFGAGKGDTNRW